jgi:hypothetical protein
MGLLSNFPCFSAGQLGNAMRCQTGLCNLAMHFTARLGYNGRTNLILLKMYRRFRKGPLTARDGECYYLLSRFSSNFYGVHPPLLPDLNLPSTTPRSHLIRQLPLPPRRAGDWSRQASLVIEILKSPCKWQPLVTTPP